MNDTCVRFVSPIRCPSACWPLPSSSAIARRWFFLITHLECSTFGKGRGKSPSARKICDLGRISRIAEWPWLVRLPRKDGGRTMSVLSAAERSARRQSVAGGRERIECRDAARWTRAFAKSAAVGRPEGWVASGCNGQESWRCGEGSRPGELRSQERLGLGGPGLGISEL